VTALVLGRYRLSARVAQGGMGEVWRGVDVGYGGVERPVALKRINPILARDSNLRQQFLDEAKLSFLLCHQNVVQVRDIGEAGGDLYIAMEWIEGADLGTIMRKLHQSAGQPLPLRFACLVGVEAARGLDYAHRLRDASGMWLSLVHRDISPSNLLCSLEGEIKVSDFGIARSRLKEQTSVPGALKGKIAYMAPEQARGESVDARADIFALGAVLYELVTAQNPFFVDGATEKEALERVRQGRVRPLRQIAPTVPQGLEAIVLRAMAARRDDRYATAAQLREDLESFARRESYALSTADFGAFVRELLQAETLPAATGDKPSGPGKRLSASRMATPRAFNEALGGALARLGTSDDDEGAVADAPAASAAENAAAATANATAHVTAPGRRALAPRTVAVASVASVASAPVGAHAAIAPPPAGAARSDVARGDDDDDRPRPPTDMTALVPRDRPSAATMAGLSLAAIALVGGAIWLARRPSAEPSSVSAAAPAPSPASATPNVAAASPSATGDKAAAQKSPSEKSATGDKAVVSVAAPTGERHKARAATRAAEAHLTITSDVAANAFVDGEFVRATPIVDLAVAPGHHVVRVESTAPGLRLIPKEQGIDLRAGELKELPMELR
jgi:eukaryotic-like serine/threonine-protein kinase